MLEKLIIKNIALIDYVEIDFSNGLNVLSGETGAGKSVIIEALNFVLGAKADRSFIRNDEQECLVTAEFFIDSNNFIDLFNELDIEKEDVLIISRKFNIDGKTSVRLNGNVITVSMLKKFTSRLVDVHGQSEHFELLSVTNQLALLDKICANELLEYKAELSAQYGLYKNTLSEIEKLGGDESHRAIRLDVLNFQINEIESASLTEGEEESLLEIKYKIANQEKIILALKQSLDLLSGDGGVLDGLANSSKLCSSISSFSNEYSQLYDRIENVFSDVSDISLTFKGVLDDLEVIEFNPEEIESRLSVIKSIKKKYGDSLDEISNFLEKAYKEKDLIENFNERYTELFSVKKSLEDKIFHLYTNISLVRKKHAEIFSKNILSELVELGMPKASFYIDFENTPEIQDCKFDSSNGFDNVKFMFSANNGQPCKPMNEIISGGEMSRFMLAVKAQASKYNDVSTFIFDEIDAGISGNVAKIVSQKFAKISVHKQVIAITHLPQILAMGDNNLLIVKSEQDNVAKTTVKSLTKEDKIEEVVRLVGGEKGDINALELAKSLVSFSDDYKSRLS